MGTPFEYRWLFDCWFTDLGSDLGVDLQMFSPKTHELDTLEALYRPIEAMVRTISEARDDGFVAAGSRFLDLSLFLRELAIQDSLAELDGIAGTW